MSLKDTLQEPVEAPAIIFHPAEPRQMIYTEAALCEKLAVQRRRLAGWRKIGALQKGVDWYFGCGLVHYTEAGAEKAAGLISGAVALPVVEAVKKERAALVDARVTGFMVNPAMLWAESPKNERFKVRVRLARKFTLGMVLAVRVVEPGLAVYEGPEPRWAKDPQFWRRFPAA